MTPIQDWKMTLEELVAGTGGRVLSQIAREYSGVGTDTRADLSGQIFVALKGDAYDAHEYLAQAVEKGAAALLVHRLPDAARSLTDKVTIVEVGDTLKGLQALGLFWRRKMKARILGITGTNGKTTTKEFAAAIISTQRNVHYSKGSLNNHWGVPMSLLAIRPSHEVALIEMGMNHPGELTDLARIAEPDVVVVTMVGRGHLEGLGSIEGVAKAKAELYEATRERATMIFNVENEHTRKMKERFEKGVSPSRLLTFAGLDYARKQGLLDAETRTRHAAPETQASERAWPELDVSLEVTSMQPESMRVRGEIRGVGGETTVAVFGAQNITNLMAASALALAAGLGADEIWTALPECKTVWGRNQWVHLPGGARVLFDGYNANPESMRAAVDNFSQLASKGRKFAVLGEMKEMGSHAASVHRELGEKVGAAGFDGLCFFGPSKHEFEAGVRASGFSKNIVLSDSYEHSLAAGMLPVLNDTDLVLMKGSRGMALEKALLDMKPLDFQAKK